MLSEITTRDPARSNCVATITTCSDYEDASLRRYEVRVNSHYGGGQLQVTRADLANLREAIDAVLSAG